MAEAELLGAGLDIEGWSFIKNEVQGKINEMTDRQEFIQFFRKKRNMLSAVKVYISILLPISF